MSHSPTRRGFLAGAGAAGGALLAGSVPADARPPDAASDRRRQADDAGAVVDGAELATVVDERVAASLEEHDLPGATAAVVAGDEVPLTAGYGVADRESEAAVDPESTLFRVGSVSKPVTATALGRQIERGALDPEAPVSEHLDFPVGEYDAPVTTAHLVTHRAGFTQSNRGLWIPDAADLRPLSAYLREGGTQARPPGEAGAYSNYGFALAGGVLAGVAGEDFHEAVRTELFDPAGMDRSSFSQPIPEELAADHATGYGSTDAYREGEFPLTGLGPAGALSTTAADMSRFLRAHLTGVVDGERVLAEETLELLHRRWAGHHDALPGVAFGLVEEYVGDVRVLRHNGATPAFYSELVLVPEHDVGLFVAYNSAGAQSAGGDVIDGVLAEVLPESETESRSPEGRPARAEELTGRYRSLRRSRDWHDRLISTLQATTVDVSVAEDGALVTETGDGTDRWIEVEPLVFERTDGRQRIAFGESDGDIEYLFHGGDPITAFDRVEGVDRLTVHLAVAVVALLGLLSAVVGWPAARFARELGFGGDDRADGDDATAAGGDDRPESDDSEPAEDQRSRADGDPGRRWLRPSPGLARAVAGGAALLLLAFPVLALVHLGMSVYAVLSAPPLTFRLLFALPLLGVFGTVATAAFAIRAWIDGYWGRVGRLHYAFVAASLLAFSWLLRYWNLLLPPG